MNCEHCEALIAEELAIGGNAESLSSECLEHLAECEACSEILELELELNRMLEEPVPFPPTDLAARVMEKIELDSAVVSSPELGLAWGERLAWMVSGAVLMFGIERLPNLSSDWALELQSQLSALSFALELPGLVSTGQVTLLAILLISIQGAMVVKVKGEAR